MDDRLFRQPLATRLRTRSAPELSAVDDLLGDFAKELKLAASTLAAHSTATRTKLGLQSLSPSTILGRLDFSTRMAGLLLEEWRGAVVNFNGEQLLSTRARHSHSSAIPWVDKPGILETSDVGSLEAWLTRLSAFQAKTKQRESAELEREAQRGFLLPEELSALTLWWQRHNAEVERLAQRLNADVAWARWRLDALKVEL